MQNAKTPAEVYELAGNRNIDSDVYPKNLTVDKFTDIAVIFDEYCKLVADSKNKFVDPDVQLTLACKKVKDCPFLKDARMWVDGFAGFTMQQKLMLAELLKTASESHIALCLDPKAIDIKKPNMAKIDPAGLFSSTERTYIELVDIIKKCGLKTSEPIILNKPMRFETSPAIAYIEKNLFAEKTTSSTSCPKTKGEICIAAAAEGRAEIRYVAKEIIKLVREQNYRYRDIAVITSGIQNYQHYIEAAFVEYNIPFFIDSRKPLTGHPVVELINSALQGLINGLASSDIFAYLKTGLVNIDACETDELQNYCIAFGVDRDDWVTKKTWRFANKEKDGFDEKRINQIRGCVMEPLLELQDKLLIKQHGLITAEEFTCAIFSFLEKLGVREKISEWTSPDDSTNEHLQFWGKLIDIFDELTELFAFEKMAAEDYFSILQNAFSSIALAFIPPAVDQVLVGSIERSRHPDLKAAFLIGVSQKDFPAGISFEGLLTEQDRAFAQNADFTLADGLERQLADREYLAYIAFTRPSQRLYMTYCLADQKGNQTIESQYLSNLKKLFGDLETCYISSQADCGPDNISSKSELADLLCLGLGKDANKNDPQKDMLCGIYDNLLKDSDKELTETTENVRYSLDYKNTAELPQSIVNEFFGDSLSCSASRLTTFAQCPYQHFAKYIIGLKERKVFRFEPMDLGSFYHEVLDSFSKRLKKGNKDLATTDEKELLGVLQKQISQLITKDSFISNFTQRSAHNAFIITAASEILEDCVIDLARISRAGQFRQIASEVWFGKNKDAAKGCEYELSNDKKVTLKGCIDRVDIANIDGKEVALVFDYKRKAKSLPWSRFYHGLDLQLGVYLLAMVGGKIEGKKIDTVAGAFYLPVEGAYEETSPDKLDDLREVFNHKAKGIFNGKYWQAFDPQEGNGWNKYYNFHVGKDGEPYGNFSRSGALKPEQFGSLLAFARQRIITLSERIFKGEIDITPSRLSNASPCGYCKYAAVCKFDWQINNYNIMQSKTKLDVIAEAESNDGN